MHFITCTPPPPKKELNLLELTDPEALKHMQTSSVCIITCSIFPVDTWTRRGEEVRILGFLLVSLLKTHRSHGDLTQYVSTYSDNKSTGEWSDRGCSLVNSTSTLSVCVCNHLTHFAILLSPKEVNVTHPIGLHSDFI